MELLETFLPARRQGGKEKQIETSTSRLSVFPAILSLLVRRQGGKEKQIEKDTSRLPAFPAILSSVRRRIRLYLPLLFLSVAQLYCSDSPKQAGSNPAKARTTHTSKSKPGSSFSDTIQITRPAAVFYSPDSMQLQKIKGVLEKQVFENTLHEYFYQMRNSRRVLEQYYPSVQIIDAKNARYLLFNKQGGGRELIDLDSRNELCGLFLFDGSQLPRPVDMMNIDTELGFYFPPAFRRK